MSMDAMWKMKDELTLKSITYRMVYVYFCVSDMERFVRKPIRVLPEDDNCRQIIECTSTYLQLIIFQEIQLKLKRSPFENCYLCKFDPSSQHLHVLGNISFEGNKKVAEEVISPVKVSLLPPFYETRHLCVSIKK